MIDYPLLNFNYNVDDYEKKLKFKSHPKFMDNFPDFYEDYYHDEFGLYQGDDEKTLAHASTNLRILENDQLNDSSKNMILESLQEDYKNYCDCVVYGSGAKKNLYELTEALLAYNCFDIVYQKTVENNEDNDTSSFGTQAFNFDHLFITEGDRLLFLDNNTKRAFEFYRLACLEWNIQDDQYDDVKLFDDYSENFTNQYITLISLENGNPILNKDEMQMYVSFKNVISNKNSDRHELLEILKKIINSDPKVTRKQRIAMCMVNILTQHFLVHELSDLGSDDPKVQKHFIDSLPRKILQLKDTKYHPLTDYIRDYPLESHSNEIFALAKTCVLTDDILTCLQAGNDEEMIAYYTSLNTFSYMLPMSNENNKKNTGKLSVMNISYMNDPNEGVVLKKAIFRSKYESNQISERRKVTVPYVFIKCFTPRIDYLPMWEMYGDHAEGCCLVINWKKTKENATHSTDALLYRVCYIHKSGNSYNVRKGDNPKLFDRTSKIKKSIYTLAAIARKLGDSEKKYFDAILGNTIYLFKDSSYSYEQELRVMYVTSRTEDIKQTSGEIPMLYVQTPFPLQIDEIILGPKYTNVNLKIPFLQKQVEEMCEINGTSMPKITLSEIEYR